MTATGMPESLGLCSRYESTRSSRAGTTDAVGSTPGPVFLPFFLHFFLARTLYTIRKGLGLILEEEEGHTQNITCRLLLYQA